MKHPIIITSNGKLTNRKTHLENMIHEALKSLVLMPRHWEESEEDKHNRLQEEYNQLWGEDNG